MASGFTAHNIRLDDGSFTKPEQPWQMEDLVLLKFTKQFLRTLFPDGVAGKRVVDLGCLEGGYTVEMARAGFDALASRFGRIILTIVSESKRLPICPT